MKTLPVLGMLLVYFTLHAQTSSHAIADTNTLPAPTPYTVVSRDANSAVWERTSYEQAPDGHIVSHLDRYVELATGLNHLQGVQWVPSSEQIELAFDGSSAYTTNGQHHVYLPGDIDNGVIKLVTPDGQTLQSQPIGLGYFDGSNSVLLATLTNSVGEILPSGNQVIYTNAFAGLDADLLYTYTRAGFEQDVILREQPPDPVSFGLNTQTTRIQVLSEFFDSPQPVVTTNTVPTAAGNLEDDSLNFGTMAMGRDNAFLLGSNSLAVGVIKQWLLINNRQFLVEEVPFEYITNELSSLPAYQTASIQPHSSLKVASTFSSRSQGHEAHVNSEFKISNSGFERASLRRLLLFETRPRHLVVAQDKGHMQLAQSSRLDQGLVLDYQMINSSQTNYTFQGDRTYYISALYVDQTGVFSNDVIVVASDTPPQVWLVNSNGSPSLLAQISANAGGNLEGAISLPNNTNQWGPWAGKILTGDEDNGILYTIDTNGAVTPYDLGVEPDHFALIPANQDLYLCAYNRGNGGQILKLSRAFLTNYVGGLLITQEGNDSSHPREIFIVNWSGTNFVTQFVNGNVVTNGIGQLEDAGFAPINLPSQPIGQ